MATAVTGPYGLTALKLENFSGLNTQIDPTNLPPFASPSCADVEYFPGSVVTRPPIVSQFAVIAGNPSVNYLKTYITPAETIRTLALDSLGILWEENPAGILLNVGTIETTGAYGNSVTLFGREYIAIGDGRFGIGIPRQFDDTNFDRVSQGGPGQSPTAQDYIASVSLLASPNGLIPAQQAVVSLVQSGSTITAVIAGGDFIFSVVGDQVVITLNVDGYNGSYTIASIISPVQAILAYPSATALPASSSGTLWANLVTIRTATTITMPTGLLVVVAAATDASYDGTFSVRFGVAGGTGSVLYIPANSRALSGGGTITTAGQISAGVHQITVIFITRNGYLTAPAPPLTWTALGGKAALVVGIPIGPPNIIARVLSFTGATGDNFFYVDPADSTVPLSGMVIYDNTTTTAIIDFTDQVLLSGNSVDDLFSLVELGECSGVTEYHSRLFWVGERNTHTDSPTAQEAESGGVFQNLEFDGGFTQGNVAPPLGWTSAAGSTGVGGYSAIALAQPVVWGDAYCIVGDGSHSVRGTITQNAFQDWENIPKIARNTSYSIRARVARNITLAQGTLHINLQSSLGAFTTTGLVVTAAQATTSYTEFTAVLTASLMTPPADLLLQIYADGTPTNAGAFLVDCIEIYPTKLPYNSYLVRASFADRPEAYDGVTGFLSVAENNGQAVRASFVLRDFLYFVKERSMYVTQDTGDEPSTWSINEVSAKVGTESVRGVGVGDEWAVIASRDGLYYFNGGLSAAWSGGEANSKLSTEIQPTWDSINWNVGHLIAVTVDTQRKRIYIAVPLGTATLPNVQLVLDYTEGFSDPLANNGTGRKWAIWNISCNSMALVERFDGTQKLFIGNNGVNAPSNGKIYQLTPGAPFNDDGVPINGYWQSGFFQDQGRLTFGYLSANVVGSGVANVQLKRGDQNDFKAVRGWDLSPNGFHNQDRQIQVERNRMAIQIGTNSLNSWFSLQGLALYVKPSIWAPLRGINA
jgi:hypothetical protein